MDHYLVGVTNKFAFFENETDDPYDLLINAEKEKLKKKAVKVSLSNENKENKGKEDPKIKNVAPKKPAAPKSSDRVGQTVKLENASNTAINRRNREEGSNNNTTGLQARGPRTDRRDRDGPRPPRNEGDSRPPRGENEGRPFRGPRPEGDSRPFRNDRDRQQGSDGEGRPPRRDRRDFGGDPDSDSRPPRRERRDFGGEGQDSDSRPPRRERRDFGGEGQDSDSRPPRRERRDFGGEGQDSDSRPPRRERRDFGGEGQDSDSRPPRRERRDFAVDGNDEGRSDRRPGGPRGRGGRPPGRNFDNRGKREFDRRSGSDRTGVKAVDKRDGAGSFNWDSTKDPEAQAAAELNVTNQSEDADWDESVTREREVFEAPVEREGEEGEQPVEDAAPAEEEPRELTLDEYRAMRGQRAPPQWNLRKPGEGEDLTQWKNMIEIRKKDAADPDTEDDLEIADIPQRVGRQRHVVGIDITFNDSFRGRKPGGGRGGPAGGRGGRNRDRDAPGGPQRRFSGREDRPPQERRDNRDRGSRPSAPKVDDEKDFPSLG